MNDYQRIARIIHYLGGCYQRQPDLGEVAAQLGLSPFHFHRMFKSWAGISPKVFVQCLTLNAAKRGLLEGRSVMEYSLEAGLSRPGRLTLRVSQELA